MHHLLIQQLIIDEVVKLVHAQGFKALNEAKFDNQELAKVLLTKGLSVDEIDKWTAYLHIEKYIELTAADHTRKPVFVTLTPKGMSVETSQYFKNEYTKLIKETRKHWVDIISQTVVGATAIIAIILSTKSCSKENQDKSCKPVINIHNTIGETTPSPNHQDTTHGVLSIPKSDSLKK